MRRLELTFPSRPDRVRPALERVVRACAGAPVAALPSVARLRVAVGEALANAVRHGNREMPFRRVVLVLRAGP